MIGGYPGTTSSAELDARYAAGWNIYVGNDPIWSNNLVCPGGPHLATNYEDVYDAHAARLIPAYGFEVWCNLPGQYTFFVATQVPSSKVTICDIAVIGTRYIRVNEVPTSVQVQVDGTQTLYAEHVYSEETIGNTIAIDMRQRIGDELAFVTLTNNVGFT